MIPKHSGSPRLAMLFRMSQTFMCFSGTHRQRRCRQSLAFRRRVEKEEEDDIVFLTMASKKRTAPALPLRNDSIVQGERVNYTGHPGELEWQCYPNIQTISRQDYGQNKELFLFTNPGEALPGLSGGPVSDAAGNLLGIIVNHISGNAAAIKISIVLSLLKSLGVAPSQTVVLSIEISPKQRSRNSELNGSWQGKLARTLMDGEDVLGFNADLTFEGDDFVGPGFEVKFSVLRTSIVGKLEGDRVQFTQSYVGGLDQSRHTMAFRGRLDRITQTIEGTWTGDAVQNEKQESGTFLLRLSSPAPINK